MEKCKACESGIYEDGVTYVARCLNPNGEFVKGYGTSPVYKAEEEKIEQCPICRHIKGTVIITM